MIKGIIFDLDGTLLNRDTSVKMFIASQYEKFYNYLSHIPKKTYISRFIELDNRGYVWKGKVYQQLVEEFHIDHLTWEELLQNYNKDFQYSCIPFADLTEMLRELKEKGFLLGMVTNGYGQFQMDNIRALDIEGFFDVILVSGWEGIKKPDPKIFMRAVSRLEISPEETIFIGDHPENDILAAQAIGMTGVWKRDPGRLDRGADYIVDDLAEFPALVQKINKGFQ